ncbi:MAG: DUF697 domain-containing protein [Synechococcaceae cyanobacterium SM2_3_1]|nr:DUF697 domain-containing protein [Synechococcaceae cyanobacterium SM2_3_1]
MSKNFSLEDLLAAFNQAYLEAEGAMGRCNVLIIGKTGVGKSTLINAVLREPLAQIGAGRPVTQAIRQYQKQDFPITVYDTPGLELGHEQVRHIQLEVAQLIEDKRLQAIDEQIHIIWYCISHMGDRLEKIEVEWLQALEKKDIPVLLVLTKTLTCQHSLFQAKLEAENLPVRQIVPILAEAYPVNQDYRVAAHGLDQLVEVTFELLPEVARKALVNGTRSIRLKAREAFKYVSGYVASAFAVGFTPIPFADAPILVTMQTTMLAHITLIFGLPFGKGFVSTVLTTIAGSGGMSLLGRTVVNNLLKLIPGVGTIAGGVISGSTAAALTMALGLAYIQSLKIYLRAQIQGQQMSMAELAQVVEREYSFYARSGQQALRNEDDDAYDL